MKYDDLPAKLREQVDAKLEPKRKRTTQRTGQRGRMEGTCACGEPFASYAAFERHSEATGHRRWVLVAAPRVLP